MSFNRERVVVIAAICVLLYFASKDIMEDIALGDGFRQIALDLLVVSTIALLLIYVYILEPLKTRFEHKEIAARAEVQSHDLARLSQIARKQLHGLGAYIKAQFDEWGLTAAEQEVALMLLKGFSMREISQMRAVSERTTRQQATTIYGKTGLSGRTGLSAFFLEDLLLPSKAG